VMAFHARKATSRAMHRSEQSGSSDAVDQSLGLSQGTREAAHSSG
jgi:hypothetical protein